MEDDKPVSIEAGGVTLEGDLRVPDSPAGVVLFAHGSGSSRHSRRNRFVAETLRESGVGTLLFDLLSREEEDEDRLRGHLRFDIDLLARRLVAATEWVRRQSSIRHLAIAYFGSSTGGAAALVAAADPGTTVQSVVSRGGRPDLAHDSLARVLAPTLLIVGELDEVVLQLNRKALDQLRCEKELEIVPGATHLFEEPGSLEQVARLAGGWFERHLCTR
jgi:putative phosphoribosyl transferase